MDGPRRWADPRGPKVPVGPGSRGGTFHIAEARAAYYRAWRRRHPEYMERERQRSLLRAAYRRLSSAIQARS